MSKAEEQNWGNICEKVDTCALTGAGAFIAGIPKSEILVNGPLWCYFYALRYLEHSDYHMANRFHGSQPDNTAVVYGSEKYILATLKRLRQQGLEPELFFIESSCSMSLIGDDLNGIAAKAELPFPFVTMDCGGLVGGFAEGYAKAALAVLEKFLSRDDEPVEHRVNLLGQTDFYLHGRDDTDEVRRLLQMAGYTIQASPGSGSSLEDIRHLGRAELNIVTNEELGLPLAQYLQKHLGTPYVLAGLPYGVEGTKAWLKKIDTALKAPQLQAALSEAEATQEYLTCWLNDARCQWGDLWYDQVLVNASPTQALCLAQGLRREFLDTDKLVVLCQRQLPHSQSKDYCQEADSVFLAGDGSFSWDEVASAQGSLLLLGSSSESSLLYRRGMKNFQSCNIAYPANEEIFLTKQPLVGLEGSKQLLQRLWNGFIQQSLRQNNQI